MTTTHTNPRKGLGGRNCRRSPTSASLDTGSFLPVSTSPRPSAGGPFQDEYVTALIARECAKADFEFARDTGCTQAISKAEKKVQDAMLRVMALEIKKARRIA